MLIKIKRILLNGMLLRTYGGRVNRHSPAVRADSNED
jgi:hypothetical protein